MEHIGTRIQTLRRNKGITQAQLAEILSVSPQSVSKWENRLSLPDVSLLPVIARFFGITMDELFGYRLDSLNYRERFIRFMANNGVLQLGRFRLQSGRISPYYINTGNYKSAGQLYRLGEFYARCMQEHNVEANLLAGNSAREAPIVIAAAMVLYRRYGIDISYTTDGSVGKPMDAADKTVLLKDTLTSGSTLRTNLKAISEATGQCTARVIVSVDRKERGENSFLSSRQEIEREYGVKIHAIVTIDDIIRAIENGIIGGAEHLDSIRQYQKEYGGE